MKLLLSNLIILSCLISCNQKPKTLTGYIWNLESVNDSIINKNSISYYEHKMLFENDSTVKEVFDHYIGGFSFKYATLYDSVLCQRKGTEENDCIYKFTDEGLLLIRKSQNIFKYSSVPATGDELNKFMLDYNLGNTNGLPDNVFRLIEDNISVEDQIDIYKQAYQDIKKKVKYPDYINIRFSPRIIKNDGASLELVHLLTPEHQWDDYHLTILLDERSGLQQYDNNLFKYWIDNDKGRYNVFNCEDEFDVPFVPIEVNSNYDDDLNLFVKAFSWLQESSPKVDVNKITRVSIVISDKRWLGVKNLDNLLVSIDFNSNVVYKSQYGKYDNNVDIIVTEYAGKYSFSLD